MYQAGLVLEGGGMKGVYTAGVLDFFWIRESNFLPATACLRGPALCAAFCPGSGGVPIM